MTSSVNYMDESLALALIFSERADFVRAFAQLDEIEQSLAIFRHIISTRYFGYVRTREREHKK